MKKKTIIFTVILAIAIMQAGYGQDTLKATYRNFLTELNVNLFQGQLTLNNALNQIKFRYMITGANALRLGVSTDSRRVVNNAENVYGTSPSKDDETMTTTMIGINFGFEKHFTGTKRLSPYIGGELTVGYKWSKDVNETNTLTTTIKGAWQQYQIIQTSNGSYSYTSYSGERGFFSYGLNLVTGFDFYMANHLFIGYELEFGFIQKNYSNIDVTYSGSSSSSYSPSPDYNNKEFSFGPRIINGIRIGYVF